MNSSHKEKIHELLKTQKPAFVQQGLELLKTVADNVEDVLELLGVSELQEGIMPQLPSFCSQTCFIELIAKLAPEWCESFHALHIQSRKIPSGIERFINLEVLKIYGCGVEFVPSEIGNLNKLRVLNLANNNISAIPDSIGNLQSLEELSLARNPIAIEGLPQSLGRLSKLKKLYVWFSNIESKEALESHLNNPSIVLFGWR